MNASIEQAAQFLAAARKSGRPGERLREELRPRDVEVALAIQRRVGELLGEEIAGWKCGAPSAGKTLAAPIFRVCTGPQCPVAVSNGKSSIEPEIAFVLARELPARTTPYSEDEVRAAIGETRLAIEILGSRYAAKDAEFLEKLADSLSNFGLYLGPVIADGLDRKLDAFPIRIDGVFDGQGRHPDGHPLKALHWLVNWLSSRGEGLRTGDAITTGSYAGALEAPGSGRLHAVYGDLGEILTELVPAG
jgi:2-keto-4-pentenoate hydratase